VIIAAARAADPHVIVMNPLGGGWSFQRAARGGLHPSAAGDAWIAAKVAATLRAQGVGARRRSRRGDLRLRRRPRAAVPAIPVSAARG
jgi:hypothetical protein